MAVGLNKKTNILIRFYGASKLSGQLATISILRVGLSPSYRSKLTTNGCNAVFNIMKCVQHTEIEAEYILNGNSVCESCFSLFSFPTDSLQPFIIKSWRLSRHFSQDQLAKLLECSGSLISYVEKGQRHFNNKQLSKLKGLMNNPTSSL